MALLYGFPALIAARLGCEEPSAGAVKKFFDDRGIDLSAEQWRLWLRDAPARPDLRNWTRIAHVLGVRLSALIEYQPEGEMPPARQRRQTARHPRVCSPQSEERPPNPRDYFRAGSHG